MSLYLFIHLFFVDITVKLPFFYQKSDKNTKYDGMMYKND